MAENITNTSNVNIASNTKSLAEMIKESKSISNLDRIRGIQDIDTTDIILKARGDKAEKKSNFLEKFEKIKSENVKKELENIFDKIEVQAEKIGDKVYLRDLLEYKRLVKEFLQVATSSSHQYSNENFLDRRGRHRSYSLVKTIDRELDTLTRDFISGQIDHKGIMEKMGEIKGMLIDIMM